MWTREELKTRGKAAFLRNYWICVVAALILTLLVGNGTSNSGNSTMTAIRLTRSVYLDLRFLPITSMWNPLQKDSPRLDRLNLFLLSSAALYFLSLVLPLF